MPDARCLMPVANWSLIASLALAAPAAAQELAPRPVRGVVYLDRNGDGQRQPGEPGLPGVVVSDQQDVVTTAGDGTFQFQGPGGHGIVFVSVPDRYRSVGPFWRSEGSTGADLEFGLATAQSPGDFTFVHASDTHLSPASLARTQRLRALVDSVHPALVLITGDLVRDALRVGETEATSYYELVRENLSRFSAPVWTVPGNHEIFGIERHRSLVSPSHPLYGKEMYRHYFGPDYYSFNYGGVHFIGLNTVDVDDLWYYGHVDSLQLAWLERDLALVPPNKPVITFDHIPFFSTSEQWSGYRDDPPAPTLIRVQGKTTFRHTVSNAAEVLALLRGHRYPIALGGHMHFRESLRYQASGLTTRFEQAAAVVEPTQEGGMVFPSGITLYRVHDGEVDAGRFIALDPDSASAR